MKYSIEFEVKHFISKKKNWVTLILFISLLIAYVGLNILLERNYQTNELNIAQTNLELAREVSDQYFADASLHTDEQIDYFNESVQLCNMVVESIKNGNWRQQLLAQNRLDELNLRTTNSYTASEKLAIKKNIEVNEILLEKNIEPVFMNCSMQAYNFIRLAFTEFIPLLMIGFILLFVTDNVSGEIEKGTVKFLLMQPISKTKLLLSKIIAQTLICLGIFTAVFGGLFLLLGIVKGFGDTDYPTVFYTGELVGISHFVAAMLPMIVLMVVAAVAFSMLMSVMFNNNASSISVPLILLTALYLMTYHLGIIVDNAQYNPLSYLYISDVLDGIPVKTLLNSKISYVNGLICLSVTAAVCYLLSAVIFRRKEIRS